MSGTTVSQPKLRLGMVGGGPGSNSKSAARVKLLSKNVPSYDPVKAIATNTPAQPDVRFAWQVNEVIDAMLASCEERR